MPKYLSKETEAKWRKRWMQAKLYKTDMTDAGRPKYYNLVMFPYPSGNKLHIGHWYNYGPADSWGRYMRMKGMNVFEPMGYDAFGLPAENYAIKTGIQPDESTRSNTATMTEQLARIGTMYDWYKTLDTSRPDYYRWTQWLFLQMYKHDLAYKKEANVNFCPHCQTVLANEQAQNGVCERCGTEVIQKPLNQWFWKITAYSERLLDGLEKLDWPEKTKLMQRNWIGRSEGAEVVFTVEGHDEVITVFTTRVDTIFSAAFVVLAPEHPLVPIITTKEQKKEVSAYQKKVATKTELQRTDLEKDKTGVFTGSYVVNPADGTRIPVWIGDFVLVNYGHGAVFGDAHDERDFVFAKKYNIPLKTTIKPVEGDDSDIRALKVCFTDDGVLYDSGEFSGLTSEEARKKISAWLADRKAGRPVVNYRLRDWLISRQRYWGAPIPIVYDPEGNAHPVPEEHLPWILPTDVEFKPTGKSPLTESKEFAARTEKIFGKGWRPEYDTMDTFVCSSFYYLRYLMVGASAGEGSLFIDPEIEKRWMPVDMYIGGPEHACMHLIYARFVMMALKDFGFVSHEEPFKKLVHQGLVTNKGAKMSKSKGNVVSPDAFVEKYGSDVFRMYLMFMGPFTEGGDWSDKGITGIARFVERFYLLMTGGREGADNTTDADSLKRNLHSAIKKVTEDIEKMQFNTAIAALMELVNACHKTGIDEEAKKTAVLLIAPLAPHLAEELWETLGGKFSIFDHEWPEYDVKLLVADSLTLAVQVNGKVRGEVTVPTGSAEETVMENAAKNENVAKYLEGKEIIKKIYVPGKLVSFVVR